MSAHSLATTLTTALAEVRRGLVPALGFSMLINLLMLALPIYTMQVFDRVLGSGHGETLLMLSLIVALALVVLGALEAVRSSVFARLGTRLGRRLGATVLAADVDAALRGNPVACKPLAELDRIRKTFCGPSIVPLFDAPWLPLLVAVLWLLHPWLGLLAAGSAALLLSLTLITDRLTKGAVAGAAGHIRAAEREAEVTVRRADLVKAMGLMPGLQNRYDDRQTQALDLQLTAAERAGVLQGISRSVRLLVQAAVMGLGAWLVLQSQLSPGGMIAASILLGRALAPLEQLIGGWRGLVAARGSYQRLKGFLAAIPAAAPAMPLPPPTGHVTVEGLGYAPPGSQQPVIHRVGFELAPGEVLGVIGPSAAGKSTLCRLLVGSLVPNCGAVRLDGAPVGTPEAQDLHRHIGYLPQDVGLFPGSIKDNIARMGSPDPAAVVEAARLAGVHDMILRLPQGYETELGEDGAGLSGGQRQRIALARALYGRPKLLVLDEPNAHLDQNGEGALLQAITALKAAGTTVVMVAHRSSALMHVDKVLVLERGTMTRFGPRDPVLRQLSQPARAAA